MASLTFREGRCRDRRYQITGDARFIKIPEFCNPGRCNFAGFDLLDGPLGAQPLTRFLTVETQTDLSVV